MSEALPEPHRQLVLRRHPPCCLPPPPPAQQQQRTGGTPPPHLGASATGLGGPSLQRVAKVYASTAEAIAHFKPTPREVISGIAPHVFDERKRRRGAAPRRGEAVLVRARRAEALVAAAWRYSDLMGRALDLSRYALTPGDVFADLNVKFDPRNAQNNPKWRRKAPPTIRMQRPPSPRRWAQRGAAYRPLPPRSTQRSRNVPPSTANRGWRYFRVDIHLLK